MSRKFKSQASSARAANATSGVSGFAGFAGPSAFQTSTSSSLSYVAEQPDLSGISDPNVVVSLRNLGKKDPTTKSKALEELQDHVTSTVEDAVITAWIALYPRTSIDNSRRVRQLAHILQGSLTAATTKRIGPHLGKAIGPWLSGLFDSDRAVSRSAQDALNQSFTTAEKQHMLWKVYRQALVDYAEDAILTQTSATLSDERSTSKDDAEAKYSRVVGSAMLMLARLVDRPDTTGKLDTIISNSTLWQFAYHSDPHLRRACHSLVMLCTDAPSLDWPALSTCFVAKGLTANQMGTSGIFTEALLHLTRSHPAIWTADYHAKTSASKKMLQFIAKGSQRGPDAFWKNLSRLVRTIPYEVITSTGARLEVEDAIAFVTALREGLNSQDEPRQNMTAAYSCYSDISFWLQDHLNGHEGRQSFLKAHPLPLVATYVNPTPGNSVLPRATGLQLATIIMLSLVERDLREAFIDTWDGLTQALTTTMKLSLPESSKDFESSQDGVAAQASRLDQLQEAILKAESSNKPAWLKPYLINASAYLIKESIDLLTNRNGKPYGAVGVLQNFAGDSSTSGTVQDFLRHNMTTLLESPSAERLVALLQYSHLPFGPCLTSLLGRPALNNHGQKALSHMLAMASAADIEAVPQLQRLQLETFSDLVPAILANPNLENSKLVENLVASVLTNTSPSTPSDVQLQTLQLLSSSISHIQAQKLLTGGNRGGQLHAQLLVLAESADDTVSRQASALLIRFQDTKVNGNTPDVTERLIQNQLAGNPPLMSILSLVDLAIREVQKRVDTPHLLEHLLPSAQNWTSALDPYFKTKEVSNLLSISSPLQGAVYGVSAVSPGEEDTTNHDAVVRDSEDFSLLFRLTLYVSRLLSTVGKTATLSNDAKQTLAQHLPLALQYVNEKLNLEAANTIWLESSSELIDEAADVLSEGNSIVREILSDEAAKWWLQLLGGLQDNTSESYHKALACVEIIGQMIEREGTGALLELFATEIRELHKSPALLRSAVVACCLRDSLAMSNAGKRLLNELVSDATDIAFGNSEESDASNQTMDGKAAMGMYGRHKIPELSSLRPLVLINIVLREDPEPLNGIQSQRLVFLMQKLVKLLAIGDFHITAETCKLLATLLLAVQDIYGDHWQQILDSLLHVWDQDTLVQGTLPLLHSSLRLYQRVKTLASSEDVNEDLLDAWRETNPNLERALLQCLQLFEEPSTGNNQPRQVTANLLGRLLSTTMVKEIAPLYRLMSTEEDAVLEATYGLLHRAIPNQQEDLSLQLALEKQIINLPPELLELLADTPDTSASRTSSKRYLLCWQLAFDHFENASYKLKEAYTASFKAAGCTPSLLNKICDVVRITDSRPVDASKFDIDTFTLSTSDSDTRELQWLAIHLYYRCLLFTPSPAKAWFNEQRNRIRTPLEAWTQKYISTSIAVATLETVTQWASTQDQEEDPVTVKTSPKAFELTASMAIDPESPPISIAVTLPTSYPLTSPSVISRSRVAVTEKKWQSWLRTLEIIIFSTGSVIEGLIAFRRNVQGAIKGHGECAICYSIIGPDMQTPNKKCGTCKNAFHGGCLYRWFRSSNSSACPLCRNNFNYA